MDLKDYNLYSLFVKAVELKNYSRVAESVGLSSHQVVSDKMKALEKSLGVKLFIRGSKGMEPTGDALALYEKAKKALSDLDLAANNLKGFDENSEAIIRMGIPSSFASVLFKDFFIEFCTKYPKVRLQFFDKDSINLLQTQEIDLLINLESAIGEHGLNTIDLFEQDCIFIASEDFCRKHNLGKVITKEVLATLPVVGHRSALLELKSIVNFVPYVETATGEPIYAFAKNGLGLGYYYGKLLSLLHDNDPTILKIAVDGVFLPKVKILCVFNNQNLTKAAETFIEDLRKFCSARL